MQAAMRAESIDQRSVQAECSTLAIEGRLGPGGGVAAPDGVAVLNFPLHGRSSEPSLRYGGGRRKNFKVFLIV